MPSLVVFFCIAMPWLNPFSFGPSPAVVPWLFSLACSASILLWARRVPLAELAASAWLSAASISAAIGLLQYFGGSAAFHPWVNTSDIGEAFANLRQRNQFATLTNIGLAALLWSTSRYCLRPVQTAGTAASSLRYGRIAPILAAVLLALGNAASSSRTGLAQMLLLLALACVWSRVGGERRRFDQWPVLLAATVAYAIGVFALPLLAGLDSHASGLIARIHNGELHCLGRLTLWSNVLHLIAQKPWFGWGWGELGFAHFLTLYPGERFCDILDNAHNLPLQLAVELGVPLSAAVCIAGVGLIWRAKPWSETGATRRLAWSVLALILLHSMLEYPLWYGPFQMALGLSVFLLWQAGDQSSQVLTGHSWLPGIASDSAILVLIFAVAYAGWDYRRISQIYQTANQRAEAYRENTLERIGDSWLFRNQVRFAELTTLTLTPENASHVHSLAADLLHFSAEPRVVEKLIESATLLGLDQERRFYELRYQAAFAQSHALWARGQTDQEIETSVDESIKPDP